MSNQLELISRDIVFARYLPCYSPLRRARTCAKPTKASSRVEREPGTKVTMREASLALLVAGAHGFGGVSKPSLTLAVAQPKCPARTSPLVAQEGRPNFLDNIFDRFDRFGLVFVQRWERAPRRIPKLALTPS